MWGFEVFKPLNLVTCVPVACYLLQVLSFKGFFVDLIYNTDFCGFYIITHE